MSDKGFIFQSLENNTLLTLDNSQTDFDVKSGADLANKEMSTGIYATTIYLTKNHN